MNESEGIKQHSSFYEYKSNTMKLHSIEDQRNMIQEAYKEDNEVNYHHLKQIMVFQRENDSY